jgi:SWI/SNF-related matrix-associated actin-dependent regulator of chromatin subfamily A protein 2/4
MLREFSKRKDEDRNRRMEALKNNDVDAYREILRQQQTQLPGDAGERFEVLSAFLTQTEEYLHKLGGKISAVKNQQEREEAALAAAAAARARVLIFSSFPIVADGYVIETFEPAILYEKFLLWRMIGGSSQLT